MVDVCLNTVNWFHFVFLNGGLLVIKIDCIIFLSPFIDVTRISISTVSFLAQQTLSLHILPIECFTLNYDLSGIKFRISRHLLTVGSF